MAIKQTNADYDFDTEEYVVDLVTDIFDLPTGTDIGWGSTALCIENGLVYILNSNKTWVPLGSSL